MKKQFKKGDKVMILGVVVATEPTKEAVRLTSNFPLKNVYLVNGCEAVIRKETSKAGVTTYRYALFNSNNEQIGSNRGINTKASAIKTLKTSFPQFKIIDKTK